MSQQKAPALPSLVTPRLMNTVPNPYVGNYPKGRKQAACWGPGGKPLVGGYEGLAPSCIIADFGNAVVNTPGTGIDAFDTQDVTLNLLDGSHLLAVLQYAVAPQVEGPPTFAHVAVQLYDTNRNVPLQVLPAQSDVVFGRGPSVAYLNELYEFEDQMAQVSVRVINQTAQQVTCQIALLCVSPQEML